MNVALAGATASIPVRMSVQEFLDWSELTDGRWELVDGEPRAMTSPLRSHGAIAAELAKLLGNYLDSHRPACSVIVEPGIVPAKLSHHNMRMPDLAVTGSPFDIDERAITDPALIVEVLSPSNQVETWSNVWAYTSIPSVREVLVVRGDTIRAALLPRRDDASWPEQPETITTGDVNLVSIGDFHAWLADVYHKTKLARR